MLNPATNQRELAYIVTIDELRPIPNYDRVEHARVGGWWVIVKKDQFKVGDPAIYIEVDSHVPEEEPFVFLAKRHFKVKSIKMCGVISQGLLMAPEDFGWSVKHNEQDNMLYIINGKDTYKLGEFLTETLKITYASDEDNKRKANSEDKYKKMAQRRPNLFKKPWARWLMRREWGRRLMFFFFGKKKDKKNGWPVGRFPGVSKTDQERCENMPWILSDKEPFIITQKCDGSSGTFILEKIGRKKYEFYVCSRNVRMADENQECFYGQHNYYWEVAKKYNIEEKMKQWLKDNPEATWVCWQGEICAPGIQKNPHHLKETHLFCFHWTDSVRGRLNIIDAVDEWHKIGMETVPIVDTDYILPDDFEELKASVDDVYYCGSVCEGGSGYPIEGYVYYKKNDPTFSFKNVSREYLLNH